MTDLVLTRERWSLRRWQRLVVGSSRWARSSGWNAWQPLAAYGLPVAIAAVAVQFWFRGGGELAAGDLVPLTVPGTDYLAHWNDATDAAGSPGFTIVSLPYFEGLRAFHDLGVGEAAFQRVWLTLLVAAAAAAVVFLTRSVFDSPLAALVAGVVSLLNAYRLVIGFDWVPVAAIVAAGLLGGLILRRARAPDRSHTAVFAAASLLLGPVFVNPPHVVLVLAWVAVCVLLACALHGAAALGRIGWFLLKAVPLALLFNLWWIVPASLTVRSSVFAQQFTAPGITGWAWTHQRASIWNVLSLTSSWAWRRPEYYPFSPGLEALPFSVLKFVPALVALLGVFLSRGRVRRASIVLAGAGLTTVWVMKGLHPPFGQANLWLYQNIPGFWLFRDPTKAALILVLVFSLLAAAAVAELERRRTVLGVTAAAAMVAAAIAYAHPLLTGGLVAGKRPLLPPAHVQVPSGWRDAAAFVDAQPAPGKAIVLPRLDYYQAPTTWGYYGASFFHQLFRRPLIEPLPGGYYSDPVVSQLVSELQQELVDRRADVRPILQALGIRFVLLRRDLDARFPGRSSLASSKLASALAHNHQLHHLRSFGLVDVYESTGTPRPEIYAAVPLVVHGTSSESLYGALDVGMSAALLAPRDVSLVSGIQPGDATLVPIRPTLTAPSSSLGHNQTAVAAGSSRIVMRFPAFSAPLRVTVGRRSFVIPAGHSRTRAVRFTASNAPTVFRFLRSDRRTLLTLGAGLARRLGDCDAYDRRTLKEAGLSAVVAAHGGVPTLRLGALDHAACVALRIPGVTPTVPFRLHLAYRGISGNTPRLCIWQAGPNRCATLPSLVSSPGWHSFDATVKLDPRTVASRLFLYADGGAVAPTATEYRDLSIEQPQSAIAVGVLPVTLRPRIEYDRVAPYEFHVHVEGARRPFLLVLSETFASGWRLEGGAHAPARATHVEVNAYANGWLVPWRGSYDLKLMYTPEKLAIWARLGDAALIPAALAFSLLGWALRLRRLRVVPQQEPARMRPRATTLAVGLRPEPKAATSATQISTRPAPSPATAGKELHDQEPRAIEPAPVEAGEIGNRVEQTRGHLASDIESLRRSTREMRESTRSLFLDALRPLDGDPRPNSNEELPVTDEGTSRKPGRDEPSPPTKTE